MKRKTLLRRNVAYYAVSLFCLALIITGIYIAGSGYDPFSASSGSLHPSSSDTSINSEISIASDVPDVSETPTPSETPIITEQISPTDPPESYNEADLSVKKLGWAYSPGGAEGVPAKNTEERIDMCRRFGGIWQGNTSKKKVYITMDVGYEHNNNTAKTLDIARDKNFRINFFIVGKLFTYPQYKDLMLRMYNEGHLVISHAWNHDKYDDLYRESGAQAVRDDLKKVEDAYFELTGSVLPKYFRFPSGEYSEAVLSVVHNAGYKSVFWSFSYRDWLRDDQPDPEESLQNMINNLHNGVVFLLHPVSDTNTKVLPDLIDAIRERGYEIALLDEFE